MADDERGAPDAGTPDPNEVAQDASPADAADSAARAARAVGAGPLDTTTTRLSTHPAEAGAALDDDRIRDALPDDLDASGYVGPYTFPNNNRRRVPGYLYIAIGAACIAAWLATRSGGAVLIDKGYLFAGVGLLAVGCYQLLSGWNLDVDERDALIINNHTVGFPVGHASAQMSWRGLRSRPTWRILVYSAEDPPATRGLVLVDGVDGEVVDWFTEVNPEDWSDLDGAITRR